MNVTVWRCDLDREIASLDTLDDAERARAASFVFEHHRRRYIAAHAFLRAVLAAALSVTPESLRFALTAHRKPYLPEHPALGFNMSHADHIAYVAIAAGEIGVDVELHRHMDDLLGVARIVFSATELYEISSASGDEQLARFLRCWTRKEAYVKAIGVGLGASLPSITVGSTTAAIELPPLAGISDIGFHVASLGSAADEYVAIATPFRPERVESIEFR